MCGFDEVDVGVRVLGRGEDGDDFVTRELVCGRGGAGEAVYFVVVAEEGEGEGVADVAGGAEDEDTRHGWEVVAGVVKGILLFGACEMGRGLSDAVGGRWIGE